MEKNLSLATIGCFLLIKVYLNTIFMLIESIIEEVSASSLNFVFDVLALA